MPSANGRLLEVSLNLAWSHWVGLGVRGSGLPPRTAVDPEALLYFTSAVGVHDPRLLGEVEDWWSRYERYVSRTRLNALANRFGPLAGPNLDAHLLSFKREKRTSGKSRLDHLATPARSLLRLRTAFGVNARAEILLELLTRRTQHTQGLTALALSQVGYSKRNIALVLDDLVMSGIIVAAHEGNRARYSLADPEGLERVLRPLPRSVGGWHLRLPVLAAFVELEHRLRNRDAVVQGIEARKTLERLRPMISAAGLPGLTQTAIAETYWPELQRWLVETVATEAVDDSRSLPGMIEGEWVRGSQEPNRPERFSSAVLPRRSANPTEDSELVCLDLVQVPTIEPANDWIWAVLSAAATTTYAHSSGLNNKELWRFVTWSFGKRRTYAVEYADSLPHESISGIYGAEAAERARADRPAVQLRLTWKRDASGDAE